MQTMMWNTDGGVVGESGGSDGGGGATAAGSLAGTKRRADDSTIGDSERFTKRFNLLSLGMYCGQRQRKAQC